MTKKITVLFLLSLIMIFAGCTNGQNAQSNVINTGSAIQSEEKIKADKIEVVHFHGDQQCFSCKTVGEYALETIQTVFPEEYKNGTITFKDINAELPENADIVLEYQARGSALFVNAIANDENHIEEDTKVWRLVLDEEQYISYFGDKLNNLLQND